MGCSGGGSGGPIPKEALALERFRGAEHVVQILDVFWEADGKPCLVMGAFGVSLHKLLKDGPPTPSQIRHAFWGMVSGVATIHGAGLIHGDVKPANILVDVAPTGWTAKIADVGSVVEALSDSRGCLHPSALRIRLRWWRLLWLWWRLR